MKITFETLSEIKFFVLHTDIAAWTRDEDFFGGLGMIITDEMPEKYKSDAAVAHNSVVYRSDRNDIIIVTPYAAELSWLAGQLCDFEREHENCPYFVEIMEMSCKGFFLMHKDDEYCAKELLLFVIDFMDKIYKDNVERANYKHFEEDD